MLGADDHFLCEIDAQEPRRPDVIRSPFVHASPAAQSMASTGAQINSLEPSKSPADAVPAVSNTSAATMGRKRLIAPPLLDRVAAAFHAGAVGTVIGLDQALLLRLRLLVLRRLLLAGPMTARHGANHCPGRGALAGVSRDRPDRRPAAAPAAAPLTRWPPPVAGPVCCGGGLEATTAGSIPVDCLAQA